jgi:hypothetical protein
MLPTSPPEILDARRPYEQAQRFLDGTIKEEILTAHELGWYGTALHPDGELADLVGDRVRIIYGRRSTIVYVFASADIPYDIAITRRSYAALELLSVDSISVRFETLTG